MNIITAPTVHVLSAPTFTDHPAYALPPDGTTAERHIANAAKVCYDSYGAGGRPVQANVEHLIAAGHGSVLEHVNVSVFIAGVSRGLSHELVRHRAGCAYSQRSTRYTDEGDAAIVLDPFYADLWTRCRNNEPLRPTEAQLLADALEHAERALVVYREQVGGLLALAPAHLTGTARRKWARGKARQWLPHALETRLVMTANLRAWRHVLVMRSHREAEAEIRRLADLLWTTLQPLAPAAFCDLRTEVVDGYVELTPASGRSV